jgi:AraC-like DNA-binding protein
VLLYHTKTAQSFTFVYKTIIYKNSGENAKMPNRRILIQNSCPQLFELGIPMFGFYDNTTSESKLDVHEHGNCYEICYLEKGMQPYYIHSQDSNEAQLYNLCGGEVFITFPHERHSTGNFNQLRGRMFWINIDVDHPFFLGLSQENIELIKNALNEIKVHIIRLPDSVTNLFKEAYTLFYQPNKANIFCACQLLSFFIMELCAQSQKADKIRLTCRSASEMSLECISFIKNNILNPELNVQMIADHLHYSRAYVMTTFRNETGISVHEYILNKKIDYAKELLKTHSITETAFILNFSSSQHFSKVFKSYTRMTPKSYKLSILG